MAYSATTGSIKEDLLSKVWYITGVSRGFGKEFARSALGRGDKVAATARDTDSLSDLVAEFGDSVLPLPLDVTNRAQVFATVAETVARFGRLDIVVNNAGYTLFGMVEEITPEQLQHQLDVNLFGVFHVTQAVLPILRAQGSGHIVQISSVGGIVAFQGMAGYHASKWALEGLTETLAQEVAQFGIKTTLVEPGGFATDNGGSSAVRTVPLPQYDGTRKAIQDLGPGAGWGDPVDAGHALLDIVDAQQPPARVFFGAKPIDIVEPVYAERLETWRRWQPVAEKADGIPVA